LHRANKQDSIHVLSYGALMFNADYDQKGHPLSFSMQILGSSTDDLFALNDVISLHYMDMKRCTFTWCNLSIVWVNPTMGRPETFQIGI